MKNENDIRFMGTVDHIAVKCDDLEKDVEEYKRLGFTLETLYEDWAMMRDARGFGIALLPPNSKHPTHLGLKGRNARRTRSRRRTRKSSDKTAPRRHIFFLHERRRRQCGRVDLLPGRLRKIILSASKYAQNTKN
jgi:hypothetical protein